MTLSLPNTGQAVIIDIGEANDIHPRNKEDVGERLARWALAKDYGIDIAYRSPEFKSMERDGNKIVITFDYVDGGLMSFDVSEIKGFTIAGADKKFVNANAKIVDTSTKNQVVVWSDAVAEPVAVRYAWANNPICNLKNVIGLPVTPFRTDDWPGVTLKRSSNLLRYGDGQSRALGRPWSAKRDKSDTTPSTVTADKQSALSLAR